MIVSELTGRKLSLPQGKHDNKRPQAAGAVGIEIELEGIDIDRDHLSLWTLTHDGSLQNGIEMVSRPLVGKDIQKALDEAKKAIGRKKPYLSFRTSVHVHVNVLDMELEHLIRYVKLYLLYEPALFRLHEDWNRYDNIFCVPARKSYAIQEGYAALISDLNHKTYSGAYVGYKYSALNPNPIASLGTLEFRHMGGSKDMVRILQWVDVLLQLKAASMTDCELTDYEEVFGKHLKILDINNDDLESGQQIINHIDFINGA